jgi:hypothetical protein
MTNDQIKVAELFFRMIVQSILVLATTSIWLGVTVALIWNPQWPIVAIESLLSLTLGYIFSYFFGVLGPRRRRWPSPFAVEVIRHLSRGARYLPVAWLSNRGECHALNRASRSATASSIAIETPLPPDSWFVITLNARTSLSTIVT